MASKTVLRLLLCLAIVTTILAGCGSPEEETPTPTPTVTRAEKIPSTAIKMLAQDDKLPPVLHSDGWAQPIPMLGPVNTAGSEDSPFITPDGNTLYFFFTPDMNIDPSKQLIDEVSGIWWTKKVNGQWTEPERVILYKGDSLDGCEVVLGDTMWFASARAGVIGPDNIDVYTAKSVDGKWTDWQNAGEQLNKEYDIGEFHLTSDQNTIYFGWGGPSGHGGRDIWVSHKVNGEWSQPENLGSVVNSGLNEDQPFLSSDGNELWFCGDSRLNPGYPGPAVFRCIKVPDGSWGKPEEIVSCFAGEPTLDSEGNLYFVHHFLNSASKPVEADIYVCRRK